MSNKFKLTKKAIESRGLPETGKVLTLNDTERKGLLVKVTETGSRTFYFRRMVEGRRKTERLGTMDELSIADARDKVLERQAMIAKTRTIDTGPTARTSPTLDDHFKVWLNEYASIHRPGTAYHDGKLYDKHISPDLGTRKLVTINQGDIKAVHSKIGRTGKKRTANSVLQLLSRIFNLAIEDRQYTGRNPVNGVKRFKENKRDRYLDGEELQSLFNVLYEATTAKDVRDIVLLALLTGARKGNILSMEWAEIKFKRQDWTIPALKTKSKEDYHIPLVDMAIKILTDRQADLSNKGKYVFPANSSTGYINTIQQRWVQVLADAEIDNFKFHDLRHTAASLMVNSGASLPMIGKVLGHRSTTTTARYAHISADPARAAITAATNSLSLIKPVKKSKGSVE